jgi:hypothetical protein
MIQCVNDSMIDRLVLRQCIYRPVVLSSVDQNYFREFSVNPPALPGEQDDREAAAPAIRLAMCDFESAVRAAGEELFYFVGIAGVAHVVAEQDRGPFQVARLPGVQKAIGGRQGEYVARVFRGRLAGMRMTGTSGQGRKREEQEYKGGPAEAHGTAAIPTGTGRKTPARLPAFVDIASQSASQPWRTSPISKEPAIVIGGRFFFKGRNLSSVVADVDRKPRAAVFGR